MKQENVQFEDGEFGTRAVLTSAWSEDAHRKILSVKPNELELNAAKGWKGLDVDFLRNYKWLLSLTIIDMNIEDISAIMELNSLISMSIVTYCDTKIDFIHFPGLKSCSIEWRKGSESLFDCAGLVKLFINRYTGKSSKPFSKLVNLRSLAILNSSLSELYGLGNLNQIRSLRLGGLRSLKSLEGIDRLSQLEDFEMQNCRSVTSLSPLGDITSLKKVNVSNNKLLDSLAPLRDLPHLDTVLFYESTNIADGDLRVIFDNPTVSNVSFQNRRHYSHKREDFAIHGKG